MSQRELERFLSDVDGNAELAAEFRRRSQDLEAAVQWARARGYDFTRAEAEALNRAGELSDDDLDLAAGGWSSTDPPPTGS
jgi:predicted ribosomally synthesized peptide with nif11-like leader